MGEASLDGVIRAAFEHLMTDRRTSLPGAIETFNATERSATVQPMISRRAPGTDPVKLPVIQNVPIVELRSSVALHHVPIAKGDPVLMIFADRAIGNWFGSSGAVPSEPLDVRQHDLSDAFAILGGLPQLLERVLPGDESAAGITVKPGTKIYLGNDSVELLALLDQMMTIFSDVAGLMTTYQTHIHTSAGADPPTDAAGWAAALVTLTTIQEQLTLIRT